MTKLWPIDFREFVKFVRLFENEEKYFINFSPSERKNGGKNVYEANAFGSEFPEPESFTRCLTFIIFRYKFHRTNGPGENTL